MRRARRPTRTARRPPPPLQRGRRAAYDGRLRKTMATTENKPNVLLATSTEGMLDSWKNANQLLELIQRA